MISKLALFAWLLGVTLVCAEPADEILFNGQNLDGWAGDPKIWRAENGAICGETTLSSLRFKNTFLIHTGPPLQDFTLRLQVRLHSGNSGIQYRSQDLSGFGVSGYQAEVANDLRCAGFLYEERGRKTLASLGEQVWHSPGGVRCLGLIAERTEYASWGFYHPMAWNDYLIVARGPYLAHYVNGFKAMEFTECEPLHGAAAGILALQVHAGPPMKVEFKNLVLRRY